MVINPMQHRESALSLTHLMKPVAGAEMSYLYMSYAVNFSRQRSPKLETNAMW